MSVINRPTTRGSKALLRWIFKTPNWTNLTNNSEWCTRSSRAWDWRLPQSELTNLDQSLRLSVYRQNASFVGITGESGSDCASCLEAVQSEKGASGSFDSGPPRSPSSLVSRYRQPNTTQKLYSNRSAPARRDFKNVLGPICVSIRKPCKVAALKGSKALR